MQHDTSTMILLADKAKFTVTLNRQDSLEKFMNHISNGLHQ